jgi:hypothetical protein
VRRSARRTKTIAIAIKPPHGVVVTAPLHTSEDEIRTMVVRHARWILRKMTEPAPAPLPPTFETGDPLPYLGDGLVLAIGESLSRYLTARLEGSTLEVGVPAAISPPERGPAIRAVLERWYRDRTRDFVTGAVDQWAPRAGAAPLGIIVREQRRRWGSCSRDGTLRFNWRIAMLHPALAEYIVVHELCHLVHLNHSKAFWDHVGRVMPNFAVHRAALRLAGRSLPL